MAFENEPKTNPTFGGKNVQNQETNPTNPRNEPEAWPGGWAWAIKPNLHNETVKKAERFSGDWKSVNIFKTLGLAFEGRHLIETSVFTPHRRFSHEQSSAALEFHPSCWRNLICGSVAGARERSSHDQSE
ncbi:MAG TPA: hypothetical protein VMT20_13510 [Terriglobia bacterium]|nr:hypothetical protein [Terriglobia bacterium]